MGGPSLNTPLFFQYYLHWMLHGFCAILFYLFLCKKKKQKEKGEKQQKKKKMWQCCFSLWFFNHQENMKIVTRNRTQLEEEKGGGVSFEFCFPVESSALPWMSSILSLVSSDGSSSSFHFSFPFFYSFSLSRFFFSFLFHGTKQHERQHAGTPKWFISIHLYDKTKKTKGYTPNIIGKNLLFPSHPTFLKNE